MYTNLQGLELRIHTFDLFMAKRDCNSWERCAKNLERECKSFGRETEKKTEKFFGFIFAAHNIFHKYQKILSYFSINSTTCTIPTIVGPTRPASTDILLGFAIFLNLRTNHTCAKSLEYFDRICNLCVCDIFAIFKNMTCMQRDRLVLLTQLMCIKKIDLGICIWTNTS